VAYEFKILSQLSHPNIVKVHEVFYSKNIYYMVTDVLTGGELFDSICEREFYTEHDARRVMRSAVESLRYCHDRNVVHRDIKPENLILKSKGPESDIQLIDFGFARVLTPERNCLSDIRGETPGMVKELMGCCARVALCGL
jgi:serine/threonine protein kinase